MKKQEMLVAGALALANVSAFGQAAAPVASSVEKLDTIVVRDIPIESDVLPQSRPFDSVYGISMNVMETPRNVTRVSREELDKISVRDPRDFSFLTSSSYTDASFGNPNVPRIRGEYADIFINGMRNSFTINGNGFPLSFNAVESINITKGPGSVMQGSGPGVGGSIDIITKRPYFDKFRGSAEFTAGMFDKYRWTADIGGPVRDNLAYRFSYTGEESGSYYLNGQFKQQALYGAMTFDPYERWSIDVNSEFVYASYTENVGINRVNQDLIDNGTYLTGTSTAGIVPGGVGTGLFNGVGTLSFGNPVKIGRDRTLSGIPGDKGRGISYNFQVIQKLLMSDNYTLRLNTFFNYEDRSKKQSYYYAQAVFDNFSIEQKAENILNFDIPLSYFGSEKHAMKTEINTGGGVRFDHVKFISNFNNEPASVYDLTLDPSTWIYPPALQTTLFAGPAIPYKSPYSGTLFGIPGRDLVNAGDTNESDLVNPYLFYQQKLDITDRISLNYGGRADFLKAFMSDPLGGPTFNGLPDKKDSAWHVLANVNVGPTVKVTDWMSAYFAYQYTQTRGSGGNGGVFTIGADEASYFHRESNLIEGGLKFNLINDSLFIGLTGFNQQRIIPTGAAGGTTSEADITGFEFEAKYQPNRNFFMLASYSYIESTLNSPQGFYNFPAAAGPNVDGSGLLFGAFAPGQEFKRAGVPEHLFNFLANYEFDFGLGFTGGVLVTGPIDTTSSGILLAPPPPFINGGSVVYRSPRIPWQYELNASIYYKVKSGMFEGLEAKLSFFNLTDEKNWNAANPFYGNDFLVAKEPFRMEGTIKYKF